MWQLPGPFSPTLPPATDTLNAGQAAEINQLATECQALGAKVAKQFQNLSGLEAMHCATAQATVHETINAGCMAHNATFSIIAAIQPNGDCEKFLHQFCTEADQVWKDMNNIIFSHQLKYDAQLVAFITTAEVTLQAKWDKIWSHVHSIAEVAGLHNKASLTLALQILDKLATLPLDHRGRWGLPAGQQCPGHQHVKPQTCAYSRAASPAGSASSAVPCFPVHSLSHSRSRTPMKGGGARSQSSSASSLFSWGTQPECPAASDPDEGSSGSSASEDDNESDCEGEACSDDEASDSGSNSDDESSSSSKSGSEEASDNEGNQQDGSDNEGKGSSSEMEGSGAGGSSSPSKSDHAESLPKASPPVKKAPEVNLITSQMISLHDLDSKDPKEQNTKQHRDAHLLDKDFGKWQDQKISETLQGGKIS